MERIANTFNLLIKPRSDHDLDKQRKLPIYEPVPSDSVGASSPSPSRTSSSTEATLQPHPSLTTMESLGGSGMMASLSSKGHTSTIYHNALFKFPKLPSLNQFLSDFTLGFADGLTVPFALTAGLSSLGQTNTVIYAGMAEICAGSISMGIGGYLAARGERRAEESDGNNEGNYDDDQTSDEEKSHLHHHDLADDGQSKLLDYLSLLNLPPHLHAQVLAHSTGLCLPQSPLLCSGFQLDEPPTTPSPPAQPSAVLSGFSISLGYLLGGILPLFPYFFVNQVSDGLAWSFGVCVVALFVFGFGKAFALTQHSSSEGRRWRRVKKSLWEGIQMVILGSVAAIAAVLCVKAFEKLV